MQRVPSRWSVATIVRVVAAAMVVGRTGIAAAQMPVCPQPDPGQPVYTACLPGGRFMVAPLLLNLAVDQLLRGDAGPITREPRSVFTSVARADTVEKNAPLVDWLGRLPALKLSRFDTATGTLRMDVPEMERSFAASVDVAGAAWQRGLELPARIEGGYWRTPGVLQMAFWQGQRVRFKVSAAGGGQELSADVDCVVVSGDGIRVVTADAATPDILVRFDQCQ